MSRKSLCQEGLLQRPWFVSLDYTMNAPQVSLIKIIQAEGGSQASQGTLKLALCRDGQLWAVFSWIAASCTTSPAYTPLQDPAATIILCRVIPKPLLAVPLSFHAGSPDTGFAPLFSGLLFKALLASDWHFYLCMETRQNETMKLRLREWILKRWKLLGDAQMLSRWKLCFFGLFPGL